MDQKGLTPRLRSLLRFIERYIAEHEVPPSFDEMREAMGLASKSGIHRMITALQDRGYVRVQPYGRRSLALIRRDGIPVHDAIWAVLINCDLTPAAAVELRRLAGAS